MGFLRRWFKKKEERSPEAGSIGESLSATVEETDLDQFTDTPDIGGSEAGNRVAQLIATAEKEGWYPVASLQVICRNCNHSLSLEKQETDAEMVAGFQDGENFIRLDSPLVCNRCRNDRFRIINRKISFQEWFHRQLESLPPCKDDPEAGFRTSETGELIRDHHFVKVDDFTELRQLISPHLDENGVFKSNFVFNYIRIPGVGDRRIHRTTGLMHRNTKSGEIVIVIRDPQNRFWFRIEKP
jgi:hypothetical protein